MANLHELDELTNNCPLHRDSRFRDVESLMARFSAHRREEEVRSSLHNPSLTLSRLLSKVRSGEISEESFKRGMFF